MKIFFSRWEGYHVKNTEETNNTVGVTQHFFRGEENYGQRTPMQCANERKSSGNGCRKNRKKMVDLKKEI